jgi:hypothetical protein
MLPQQFAITEECWKEWKNHYFVGAFIIVLTITAVTHLTHLVMISDYSDYFVRIFTDQCTNFKRHIVIILGIGDSLGGLVENTYLLLKSF